MTPSSLDAGVFAARLFEQHGKAVRRYFYRLTRRADTADDLAQEVFLRVVRAVPLYEPRERERPWIFRIAQNVLRDHHRRRARSIEDPTDAEAAAPAGQAVTIDLDRALATLAHEERESFLLGEVAGLTYVEIAALTGVTVSAVRSRIYRARLALREILIPPAPIVTGAHVVHDHDD